MYVCASLTMRPQDGVGSGTPSPRYESPASTTTAPDMPSAASTTAPGSTPGRRWRRMMRASEAPRARAACDADNDRDGEHRGREDGREHDQEEERRHGEHEIDQPHERGFDRAPEV